MLKSLLALWLHPQDKTLAKMDKEFMGGGGNSERYPKKSQTKRNKLKLLIYSAASKMDSEKRETYICRLLGTFLFFAFLWFSETGMRLWQIVVPHHSKNAHPTPTLSKPKRNLSKACNSCKNGLRWIFRCFLFVCNMNVKK